MMKCPDKEMLTAYADDKIRNDNLREHIKAHIQSCTTCYEWLSTYQALQELGNEINPAPKAIPSLKLPPALKSAFSQIVDVDHGTKDTLEETDDPEVRQWQRRLNQSLKYLASQNRQLFGPIGEHLEQLATIARDHAQAALNVTMDSLQQTGSVFLSAASRACLDSDASMQFRYAEATATSGRGPIKLRGTVRKIELQTNNKTGTDTGIFATPELPEGRVIAEADSVSVEFLSLIRPSPLVVLVPEDEDLPPQSAQAVESGNAMKVRFGNLSAGNYMIAIYNIQELQRIHQELAGMS